MSNYTAWIDDVHLITIHIDELDPLRKHIDTLPIVYWEDKQTYFHMEFHRVRDNHTIQFEHHEELPIGEELILLWGEQQIPLYPRDIVRTEHFDLKHADPNAALGPSCSAEEAVFRVWTPVATSVEVNVEGNLYPMNRGEFGVWTLQLTGDWHGSLYHFEALIHGKRVKANDPYGKGLVANSQTAVLIDFSRTYQVEEPELATGHPLDAVIYELHVRDATVHPNSGVVNKGKYLGLTETNTMTPNGYSTGLTYIKDLGVTHIQLLPINDFARVPEHEPENGYNWGYDPLHFQVPEGSYSVLPDRPTARINELKKMIQAIHGEGIGIIQDMVLNHVYKMEESDFEKLVPGYYFRYHKNGTPSNGTGVGNDLATERRMVRKFILDTIDFWLKEYRMDGFRFDLMGSMDIETMQLIKDRCLQEKRMILLLGEGWDLATALPSDKKAITAHADQLKGIGFFNDYFRDTLKGKLFHSGDVGFINGHGRFGERIAALIRGATLVEGLSHHDLSQTVNYVECHDNHTLWDRLSLTNPEDDAANRKKMHQLGTALTILSQGIPFLHAGQEFFRTKYGIDNSYISGDSINQLDWNRREAEDEYVQFVRKLIQIRRDNEVFRLRTKKEALERIYALPEKHPLFGFTLLGDRKDFAVFFNTSNSDQQVKLPAPGNWSISVTNIPSERSSQEEIRGESVSVLGYEVIVLEKNR